MNYREIVRDAWDFAQNEKKLMYFYAFLPSLVTTIAGVVYIGYQGLSLKRYFSDESSILVDLAQMGWNFVDGNPGIIPFALAAFIILAFLYLFYPTYNEGALVQFIARRYNKQKITMLSGLRYGAKSFFPLLELNAIFGVLSVSALLAYATMIIRTLGPEILKFVGPILGLAGIFSLVMAFLFTYAKYFIVIDDESVFSAIGKSTDLVIDHWKSTVLMILILFLIGLRILLNIVLIIVIPGLIVVMAGLFVSLALNIVGYVIAVIIGLLGLILAGYLGGILSVFSHAVWTFTFLELTSAEQVSARDEG